MATFYYSPNQNPPTPPAYILDATKDIASNNKWYDSSRTWGEYWQQWENYYGYGKKPSQPSVQTAMLLELLPDQRDSLSYDYAFPFGVDPNEPSKPYAPHGFYCDADGNDAPYVQFNERYTLQYELKQHPDATDPASPLNVYNVDSPMDPYNMQQFFYAAKPGSPWHQYERQPDQNAPWEPAEKDQKGIVRWWKQPSLPGYVEYSDNGIAFKDTPENFPWLHDQDPSHHYRNGNLQNPFMSSMPMNWLPGPTQPQPNITEKIYLDSPVAPAGWQEVVPPANNAAQ